MPFHVFSGHRRKDHFSTRDADPWRGGSGRVGVEGLGFRGVWGPPRGALFRASFIESSRARNRDARRAKGSAAMPDRSNEKPIIDRDVVRRLRTPPSEDERANWPSFTMAEVRAHRFLTDPGGWIVVRERVFDVTAFARTHPGFLTPGRCPRRSRWRARSARTRRRSLRRSQPESVDAARGFSNRYASSRRGDVERGRGREAGDTGTDVVIER